MEQAVIAHLRLKEGAFGSPKEREAVRDLERRLERATQADAAGEFDGDEFGNYGDSALNCSPGPRG
jgi:hypothetical protein